MSRDSSPTPSSPPSNWTLSISAVLESVLEKMNDEDLLVCRLVCQSWAKEAGRIIGKRLGNREWCLLHQLETLRAIQKCSGISIPLKNLRLQVPAFFSFNQSSIQSYCTVTSLDLSCFPSLVPHFLVNIFPNLESLCLYEPYGLRYDGLVASSAVVWDNGTTFPRLRYLKLYGYSDAVWMSFVDKLLEKAEKLESINVILAKTSPVATLIAKVCSTSLKSMKVVYVSSIRISETFFTALKNQPINFPLETIKLARINSNTIGKLDVKLLLTRYSSTLSKLVLKFDETYEMNFPLGVRMTNLHRLDIEQFCGSMEWRNLLNLKTLTLERSNFEGIAYSISSAPTFCRLEALKITEVKDEKEKFVPIFREIAEHLGPQLKSFEWRNPYSEALLPVIFDKLTQLNRLLIWDYERVPPKSTNINLCGGDSFTFRRPRERIRGPPLKTLYKRLIASARKSIHVRGPNITNLKNLQFLRLSSEFSEVAVHYGIVQCEMLKEVILDFPVCPETKDSIVHLFVNAGLKHLTTVELDGINQLSLAR